ncbi:hypothetical protein I552_3294 [Mycobacterium xenopi 3993]|nr:hypothetical protein I552_3294 [Mycobacterium xenopi 3993]
MLSSSCAPRTVYLTPALPLRSGHRGGGNVLVRPQCDLGHTMHVGVT